MNKTKQVLKTEIYGTLNDLAKLSEGKLKNIIHEELWRFAAEREKQLFETNVYVLPSCIVPGLVVARKVARRLNFDTTYQESLSNALRVAIYNEVMIDENLLKIIKILEEIITAEGPMNVNEKRELQDTLETLGSMHTKINQAEAEGIPELSPGPDELPATLPTEEL